MPSGIFESDGIAFMRGNMTRLLRKFGIAAALAAAGLCAGATSAGAQTVSGQVLDQASNAPLPGVVVILLDASDRAAEQSLTNQSGEYRLTAAGAGTYRVRTLRIGYRPATSEAFALAAGQDLQLPPLRAGAPISLDTVVVVGRNRCRAVDDAAATFALWEQARTALTATRISGRSRAMSATVVTFARTLDPGSRRVREEFARLSSGMATRLWNSLPADSLSRVGYIVLDENNWTTYYAPDLDVLLADEFVEGHCFRIAEGSDASRVGIEFEPNRDRQDVVDIRGTMWLDRKSSELRGLEFRYVNVSQYHERAGAGGEMRFVRLANGAWLISRWSITMPVLEQRMVAGTGFGNTRIPETSVTELRVEGGAVALVRQAGDTLWASQPVVLAGQVLDSLSGTPVPGTRVALRGTPLDAVTDSAGRFGIRGTLPGEYTMDVRTPTLQSLGAMHSVPVILTDSATDLTIRVPAAAQLARASCGDAAGGLLSGQVFAGGTSAPRDVKVVAEWTEITANSGDASRGFTRRAKWLEARTDGRGLYRICNVPFDTKVAVRAETDTAASAPVEVMLAKGHPISSADLTINQRATPYAVFTGRVISDYDGTPIADVEVVFPELSRNAFTNQDGQFRIGQLPAGTHAFQVRKIGYRQFTDRMVLGAGQTLERPVLLARIQLLDTISVAANPLLRDFEDNRRIGLGKFFTRTDMEKITGRHISTLFEQIGGVELIRGHGSRAWIASSRGVGRNVPGVDGSDAAMGAKPGKCYAQVYLDNQPIYRATPQDKWIPPEPLFDINLIPPESIEAIEYYPGPASTPARYSALNSHCGVVVIHTRRYEPKKAETPPAGRP